MKDILHTRLWLAGIAMLILVAQGCAITPWEACASAKTPDVQGTCYYGVWAITEEQAADLYEDVNVSPDVKAFIKSADAKGKPLADGLLESALTYGQVRRDVKAGRETQSTLETVGANLQDWFDRALPVMKQLVDAVSGLVD